MNQKNISITVEESEEELKSQGAVRQKRISKIPDKFNYYVLLTYNEALSSTEKEKCNEHAIDDELRSQEENEV